MLQNIYGNTALHCAVQSGCLEDKFLIEELNCPPDIKGQQNMTPFQMATHKKHYDIAQYLQKHSVIHIVLTVMKQLGLFD